MSKLKLSVSIGNYDRTLALKDGRVGIEGCDINVVSLEPEEAFHRAFRYEEFDVTEISMSSHMMTTARGDNQNGGIPAFLSRVFRHSGIYVRAGGPIREAADLRGKKIAMTWAYSPSYGKPLSVPQGIITLMTRFGMDVTLAHPEGYAIIQALDGNVLVPILFSEVVSLHPVAIILAVLVYYFGPHHPPVADELLPLNRGRRLLGVLAVLMFVVCFTPTPIDILGLGQ